MRTEIRESDSENYGDSAAFTSVGTTIKIPVMAPVNSVLNQSKVQHPAFRMVKYVLQDILRSKFIIAYTLFLLIVSVSMFQLGGGGAKGLTSLLNILLIVVPMVSIIFSTVHFYNSYEFMELLVAQPVSRSRIFLSQYTGLASALTLSLLAGAGIPVLLFDGSTLGLTMIIAGVGLTLVFVSLAMLASVWTRDKAKGIGIALLLWFYFSLIYDGLVLMIMFSFADYPLEKYVWIITLLNPVDLARIVILLQMDVAALMGFTGAVYKDFFGSGTGILFSSAVMLLWIGMPLWIGLRIFRRKDL